MKFSKPAIASVLAAAMCPATASGYNLFAPTLFEPVLTYSPFMRQQSRGLTRSFDDAFKQMSPRYEIHNTDDLLQISMDVPGMKMEDINVSIEDGGKYLSVRGSRQSRSDSSSYSSQFSQSFSLDQVIDVDNIQANLMDGVLTVTAPKDMKRLEESVRSIPISTSAPSVLQAAEKEAEMKTDEEVHDIHVEAVQEGAQKEEEDSEKIEL